MYQTTATLPADYGCPDVPRRLDHLHTLPGRTLPPAGSTANDPAWSPDGHRIAFSSGATVCTSGDGVGQDSALIWVVDATGGDPHRVTLGGPLDRSPTWSPDGRRIAFARADIYRGTGGIYAVGIDGHSLTRLLARTAISVDWSPDGHSIAYIPGERLAFGYSAADRIEILDLRSGRVQRFQVSEPYDLAWSPDGHRIAVTTRDDALSIVDTNGKATRRIPVPGSPRWLNGVTWSPEGRRLAYSDGTTIYTVSLDTGARKRVTDGLAPDWRPYVHGQRAAR